MTLYNQTQKGKFVTTLISIVAISVLTIFLLQMGENPLPWEVMVLLMAIFIFIILSFYKLTITINKEKIVAKFGVGWIKRSIKISDIDYSSIEEVKVSSLYGIGIRLTPHGLLYNVKTGNAIKIKSENGKTFFVGTDDFNTINSVLKSLKN